MDAREISVRPPVFGGRRIPVRHLNADEDTDHDDKKIERNSGPFLFFEMSNDAAQDHEVGLSVGDALPVIAPFRL